jgi:hypothetical protein
MLNRFSLLAQMLTWKAYNQGKKSEFKRSLTLQAEVYSGAQYKYPGFFMYRTAADEGVCDDCAPLSGVMSEDYDELIGETGEPPLHLNCLPGNTLVSPCGRITGVSKRVFDGDLVIIHTAGGRDLSVTPNHPVACEQGWVPAHLLNEGDNVICEGRGQIGFPNFRFDKHQDMPAPIEEVANAFLMMPSALRREVPTAPEDFHGDGRNSEIAIIGTNRHLLPNRKPSFTKQTSKTPFVKRNMPLIELVGFSPFDSLSETLLSSLGDNVGGSNLPFSLGGGHSGPLQQLSLMRASNVNTISLQAVADSAPINPELLSELILGNSRDILLDQIVSIESKPFHDYVYNLETTNGYYTVEGLIIHNCRCEIVGRPTVPIVESQDRFRESWEQEQDQEVT